MGRTFSDEDFSDAVAEAAPQPQAPAAPAPTDKDSGLDFLLKSAGIDPKQVALNIAAQSIPALQRPMSIARGGDSILGFVAQLGQFANQGNQNLAEVGAEAGGRAGAALERSGYPITGKAVSGGAVAAGGALGTLSEALIPQTKLGVAVTAAAPLAPAVKRLIGPVTKAAERAAKPGIIAQLAEARTKVRAPDVQQILDDETVWKAPSIAKANELYKEAIGSLKGATRSLSEKLNKTVLKPSDFEDAINETGRILNGTAVNEAGKPIQMDPQTALDGLQSINRFMRNKTYTQGLDDAQKIEIMGVKDRLMSWMENNGAPKLREAAKLVRKAHLREEMSSIMPRNKYGGTDALRTALGTGQLASAISAIGGGLVAGHPGAGLAVAAPLAAHAATTSPWLWGSGIRNTQAAIRHGSDPDKSSKLVNLLLNYAKSRDKNGGQK